MKPREHLGVLIASLLLVAVLYGFLRVRPARSEIETLEGNTREAEARLAAMPSPGEPMGDPGQLEATLRDVEREMTREQARLDALEKGVVALDDPAALYRLQTEMKVWARKCGMRILETSESPAPSDGRPRLKLRAETSYADFLKFLRGFRERSGNVTVAEYLLEPAKVAEEAGAGSGLEATMTLAF